MASPDEFQSAARNVTVNIASGGTVSGAAHLGGSSLIGIVMPAAFTGATITFQTSHDGTTYQVLRDGYGTSVTVTVAQGLNISMGNFIHFLMGWEYLKIVSASAETRTGGTDLILVTDGSI